jgi:acetate kinase
MSAPAPFAAAVDPVLVLNCGSSSIKFALFDASTLTTTRAPLWAGRVEGIGTAAASLAAVDAAPTPLTVSAERPYHDALQAVRACVQRRAGGRLPAMVAHRVVHGGGKYTRPVRIDREVLAELELLVPLAPLHQPYALHAMQILLDELPGLPQVACFDTGFHSTLPLVEQMLPLPHALWERGIRRYGFHGLSYEYLSIALAERHGAHARCRTIVAHLGSGASLCAMQNLQSVATTTGFSALDGLMMGTRCGALDPGVVLHLLEQENYSVEQVGALLYQESGLLGVSGCSSSVKSLLDAEADNPRARTALALYVRRIVREIGALTAVLGGLDLLAFTAGVGERSAELRARICAALQWLGVELDSDANRAGAATISAAGSAVRVAVEPTNEEWIAASHAVHVLRGNAPVAARHALA